VTFPEGVDPADEAFAPRLGPIHVRERQSDKRLLSWLPTAGSNRRLDYVTRVLAAASVVGLREWVLPALMAMGLFTGIFNVGALSLMMEMTVPGATGLYMGLWGTSQVMAQGMASVGSGALHTGLIGSGLIEPSYAYAAIFGFEAAGLLIAASLVIGVSTARFRASQMAPLSTADLTRSMAANSTA
jgi:BCD family chlorophyll transporter-like MFS transporter